MASIWNPRSIAIDALRSYYITDGEGCTVRKVARSTGIITSVAGTGSCGFGGDGAQATLANLDHPWGIALDSSGDKIYIADTSNQRVRLVMTRTGIITTFAGTGTSGYSGDNGAATSADLDGVVSVAVDALGDVYIGDCCRVRKVTLATGFITTLVNVSNPENLAVDTTGNVFIASPGRHLVYKYTISSGALIIVAGTGMASSRGKLLPNTSNTAY
jgi:DNA-binding beta-propeller fold protein YncE